MTESGNNIHAVRFIYDSVIIVFGSWSRQLSLRASVVRDDGLSRRGSSGAGTWFLPVKRIAMVHVRLIVAMREGTGVRVCVCVHGVGVCVCVRACVCVKM